MKVKDIKKQFENPDNKYRSTPYWIWNGAITKERITKSLEDFNAKGNGGVLIHARVGLITEYLSEDWFDLWAWSLEECKRLNMECNIFDENMYPPPTGGGITYAECKLPASYIIADEDLNVSVVECEPTGWHGGFPPVDALNPKVTEAFIKNTYAEYAKRFGDDYGKTIQFSYNDEAGTRPTMHPKENCLPYSSLFDETFESMHGYKIKDVIVDLYKDSERAKATRFDYYSTIQEMFEQNSYKPLFDFCEEKNIKFSGHLWEHYWPEPFDLPSSMAAYRYYQMPGIDILGDQYFADDHKHNAIFLLTLKEVASVANQLGKDGVACESFGAAGYETKISQLKGMADFLITHGVTKVIEHLSFDSTAGSRKYDFPQTLSEHSAWWDQYKSLGDHIGRLSMLRAVGKTISRVLIIHPTSSAWIKANPASSESATYITDLRKNYSEFLQTLSDAQVDYDLGDELIMADCASVTPEGKMKVGEQVYDLVIMPEGFENCIESTANLLLEYSNKGTLLSLEDAPEYINGRKSDKLNNLKTERVTKSEILSKIKNLISPLVKTETVFGLDAHVAHIANQLEDNSVLHIFANTSDMKIEQTISLKDCKGLEEWNTIDAEIKTIDYSKGEIKLILNPGEVKILKTLDFEKKPEELNKAKTISQVSDNEVKRLDPNVMMIDFCDIQIGTEVKKDISVVIADDFAWKAQGFTGNRWRNIQYKRNIVDHVFEKGKGFTVDYYVDIEEDAIDGIDKVAIENAELYNVKINDKNIEVTGDRWQDDCITAIPCKGYLQAGKNKITISLESFHCLSEIDRIYLLGDFALSPVEKGFKIVKEQSLVRGDLTKQGLYFYNGRISSKSFFTLEEKADSIAIKHDVLGEGATSVKIDNGKEHNLDMSNCETKIKGPFDLGEHNLEFTVYTTPRNLLGPHFWDKPLPDYKKLTGHYSWFWSQRENQPSGNKYKFVPLIVK